METGFVLHAQPWRETSLIVDLLSRQRGRAAAVAKGARRPRSALRAVLLPFQPLELTLSGRSDLKTLTRAEWIGGLPMPQGDSLIFGFYMNELLVRLLIRDDPHPEVFDAYLEALEALGEKGAKESILRQFEWKLLRGVGYAPDMRRDRDGRPIEAARHYRLVDGQWVPLIDAMTGGATEAANDAFGGQILLDIAAGRYDAPGVASPARRLSRLLIGEQLQGIPLMTRRILIDLQRMENHD